jgi:hypothetical protein
MAQQPDPHSDFVLTDGAAAQTAEAGTDQPIGRDEAERAHESSTSAAADADSTTDTLQPPAVPLSVRFGTEGGGR